MLTLKNFLCLCLFVTSFKAGKSAGNALEETSDAELKKLIAQENFVVVLFSKLPIEVTSMSKYSYLFFLHCSNAYIYKYSIFVSFTKHQCHRN